MLDARQDAPSAPPGVSWKATVVVSVLLLVIGAGAVVVIFSTEPKATPEGAAKKTEMLVDVVRAERGTFRPEIVATGTIKTDKDVVVSPSVSGAIKWMAADLKPGAFVEKGATLARIESADYRNVVRQRQSDLRQALTDLDLEAARHDVAKQEVTVLEQNLSGSTRDRALRVPQLEAVRAKVSAAEAAVRQARRDLGRTTVTAPFSGQILSREVNVGSYVSPGDPMLRLVGVDEYWVVITLPRAQLQWLSFADDRGEGGSSVRVRNRGAWGEGVYRTGQLQSLIGALDEQTRMVRVIASIPDPLLRAGGEENGAPVLMIGDFVQARIESKEIANAVQLDRRHLRAGDTVWLMKDDKLSIRKVTVAFRDETHAYVVRGIEPGDSIVTTQLARVKEGAPLRPRAADAEPHAR